VAIGLAFGAYFVWWSLEVLDRLAPENEEPTPAVGRMVKVHAAPKGSPWMWTLGKPLKRILERAHQYRVIAERLQFHLDRENLPKEAADLVRIAQAALAEAAGVVEESVGFREEPLAPVESFPRGAPHKISKVLDEGVPETLPFELQDRSGGVSFWRNAQ
jgi:hypothetical protein